MRVLIVAEPGFEGVFRHFEGLCDFLLEKGVEVDLAYSDVRSMPDLFRLVDRVRAAGGETVNLRISNAPGPRDLSAAWRLLALIRRRRPDVVHAHSSKAGALVRLLARFFPQRKIFYTPNAYFGMGGKKGFAVALFDAVERWLAPVGTTINISPDEARFAREHLGVRMENQVIIHNPTRLDRFVPPTASQRAESRKRFGLPPGARVLGSSGRLVFQKDPDTLFRAMIRVMTVHPDVWFLHLGKGELDPVLVELAGREGCFDRIVRVAHLDDMSGFYHALDGFVMTSRYEAGWPIVILEAMACGLPIVSSLAPGTSGISEAGLSHCWTGRPGEVEDFVKALEALLKDRENLRPSNHRRIVEENFTPEACYGKVLACYRER